MEFRVIAGSTVHRFALAADTSLASMWSPSDDGPDVHVFAWQVGEMYVAEIEVGNTSLVVGDASKTKPRLHAEVEVEGPRDLITWQSRPSWPDDWPIGRATWRRLVFAPSDAPQSEIDAQLYGTFCGDWRQRAKTYGPCLMPLPKLGDQQYSKLKSADAATLRMVRSNLSGAYPQPFKLEDSADGVLLPYGGWAPHGPSDPGQVGGSGIYLHGNGYHQNKADLRVAMFMAVTEHERMKRYYRRDTGEPIGTESYPGQTPDVWAYGAPPEALIDDDGGDPLPPSYDPAHLSRGLRRTMQAAEQCDSPMAKRSIAGIAALERLRYSHRGRPGKPGYWPGNLFALQGYAYAAPHTGIVGSIAGRQLAWPALVNALDDKLNQPDAERLEWLSAFNTFIETATPPLGPIQKSMSGSGWPQVPYYSCQTFEQALLAWGDVAVSKRLGRSPNIFVHRVAENIFGPDAQGPLLPYSGTSVGPRHYIKTAEPDGKLVEKLDEGNDYGDPAHATCLVALMASIEPDPKRWVERGAQLGTAFPDAASKLSWLTSASAPTLNMDAAWVAQAQRIQA